MVQDRRKSVPLFCRIEVSAFAAVMFALLIFFAAREAARNPDLPSVVVDLPRTSNPHPLSAALREDALFISVMMDGKTWFGEELVGSADLPLRIQERLKQGGERKVYFKVDRRARYGTFREALEGVRSAGVTNIAILTDKRHPAENP